MRLDQLYKLVEGNEAYCLPYNMHRNKQYLYFTSIYKMKNNVSESNTIECLYSIMVSKYLLNGTLKPIYRLINWSTLQIRTSEYRRKYGRNENSNHQMISNHLTIYKDAGYEDSQILLLSIWMDSSILEKNFYC
jgi:hypothetical protein